MNEDNIIDKMNCLVELHLHLDGGLSIKNCRHLAKIQNIKTNERNTKIMKNSRKKQGREEKRWKNY